MTRDAAPPGGIGGEAAALGLRAAKSASAFRTISEVATELDVPQHVLRFWETKFNQIKPLKRGGGRRYYRPEDIELLRAIRALLYNDGYTIKGVQKLLRDGGTKSVRGRPDADSTPDSAKDVQAKDIKERREPVFVAEPLANRNPAAAPSPAGHAQRASLDGETRASLKALLGELQALRDLFQK